MGILVSDYNETLTRYDFFAAETLRERGERFHPFERSVEIANQLQKTRC
jgi:hypothetical protein